MKEKGLSKNEGKQSKLLRKSVWHIKNAAMRAIQRKIMMAPLVISTPLLN